jgi:regulatory protein YycI of two-component signal transduction system YycFG
MKNSILIIVFLMTTCCLHAQFQQKKIKKTQDTNVSSANNVSDNGSNASIDASLNKKTAGASSSVDETSANKVPRKKFKSRPGGFPPIPRPKERHNDIQNGNIIENK